MNPFPKHLIFAGLFLAVAALLALPVAQSNFWLVWQVWLPVFYWLIGGACGYLTLGLDRLVDIYIVRPDTKLAQTVKEYLARNQLHYGWKILMANKKLQPNLTFRSALFQIVWVALAFFTMTSTPSLFGKGFIMGLGIHLLLDEWGDFGKDRGYLKHWLFWQINRDFSDTELKFYLWSMTGIVGWLLLMVI